MKASLILWLKLWSLWLHCWCKYGHKEDNMYTSHVSIIILLFFVTYCWVLFFVTCGFSCWVYYRPVLLFIFCVSCLIGIKRGNRKPMKSTENSMQQTSSHEAPIKKQIPKAEQHHHKALPPVQISQSTRQGPSTYQVMGGKPTALKKVSLKQILTSKFQMLTGLIHNNYILI